MAQSAATVTPPNPTPPTNMSFTGVTGPNPPNFTKVNYAEPFGARNADGSFVDESPPGVRQNPNPPPYFDDAAGGVANTLTFAANTAALAGGTGATSGGTEGTFPGTDTAPFDTPNRVGAVPAPTSVAHEGTGIEQTVTQTYAAGVMVPGVGTTYLPVGAAWAAGDPGGPVRTMSTNAPALTQGTMPQPNATHASSLSPATNPTLASISPTTTTAGASGTDVITATGTGFNSQSVMWVHHVAIAGLMPQPVPTTFVSATSLTGVVPKRPTAAPASTIIYVVTGGVVTTVTKLLAYT